ncbi:MAG: DUF2070 family protein [Candidatus Nanohalobium sp.]
MGTDNLDSFRRVIFSVPEFKQVLTVVLVSGLIFPLGITSLLSIVSSSSFSVSLFVFLALAVFIIPSLLVGAAVYRFLPSYPRNWAYSIGFLNQLVFFFTGLIMAAASSVSMVWNMVWLGVLISYITTFTVLGATEKPGYLKRVAVLSSLQAGIVITVFHLSLGQFYAIPPLAYVLNFARLAVMTAILVGIFFLFDYLLRTNVVNVSAFQLISGLVQGRQEALDLGRPVKPDVQTVSIQNKSSDLLVALPWVHPGPLEGFGGGKITNQIIEAVNREGEGFFFHAPTTHQSDPADPKDAQKIVEELENPETVSKASKLYKKECERTTFYGRAFGDQKIIYMDVEGFDDYEASIFKEVIDMDNVAVVDLHNHEFFGERAEMVLDTVMAEKMREKVQEFVRELDGLDQYAYSAGFDVDLGDPALFSLVEEVNGQKTLLTGFEGNGASQDLEKVKQDVQNKYDEVLLFSTDTHGSVHDMANEGELEQSRAKSTVRKAEEKLSKAAIGLAHGKADRMNLLKKDYSSLILSVNILVRLLGLTFLLFYLLAVAWIL